MEILLVIDMQNDFIDGSLGTKEAVAIVPLVLDKVKSWTGPVVFTRDTHKDNYLNTQEGKYLPVPHCLHGTHGWEICDVLQPYAIGTILDKPTFGGLDLIGCVREILLENSVQEQELTITLVGLCTEICVLSNAILLKPAFPEAKIQVDGSCCAGVTAESHKNALSVMPFCQISVIDT